MVQQKQGLVRPTGAVDGMPLNTSPALERAADAMAVTFAPASAVPGPDVVQGVLAYPDGTELSDEDIDALKKLVLDSMVAMMEQVTTHNDYFGPGGLGIAEDESSPFIDALVSACCMLDHHLKKCNEIEGNYPVAKVLRDFMENAFTNGMPKKPSSNFIFLMSSQYEPSAICQEDEKLYSRNSGEKIQELLDSFRLPSRAAIGIDKIRADGSDQAMAALEEARTGNSGTLRPSDNPTWEQQAAREQNIARFRQGAAVARQRADALRDMPADQIDFRTLTDIFFQINAQVRGGESGAGRLRGHSITAGKIIGPGAVALPEQTYRTFFALAKQLRQFKATTDPNLAKTQAAHLAAFAYQMTISEHLFSDGNGRTCHLFSDTILQAFDLPPAAPVRALGRAGKDLGGEDLDFASGNIAFVQGLRRSHNILRGMPLRNLNTDPRTLEIPKAVPGGMGLDKNDGPVYMDAALAGIENELAYFY